MKHLFLAHSGGLDSTTLLYHALEEGFVVHPVNFVYSKRSLLEAQICKELHYEALDLEPIVVDLRDHVPSRKVVKQKMDERYGLTQYFPSRNLLFAVYLAVYAEFFAIENDLNEIYIGLAIHRHTTYREYWDITPWFAESLQMLLNHNYTTNIKVYVPFVEWDKAQIVRRALELGVDWRKTLTCYEPIVDENVVRPCKQCQACVEREVLGKKVGVEGINDYEIVLRGEVSGME